MTHALIKNNEKKSHREEGEVVPGDYFVCPYLGGGGERGMGKATCLCKFRSFLRGGGG